MLWPLVLAATPSIVLGWLFAGPVVGVLAGVIAAIVAALYTIPMDRNAAAPRRNLAAR